VASVWLPPVCWAGVDAKGPSKINRSIRLSARCRFSARRDGIVPLTVKGMGAETDGLGINEVVDIDQLGAAFGTQLAAVVLLLLRRAADARRCRAP
jgi:hypothetical protein